MNHFAAVFSHVFISTLERERDTGRYGERNRKSAREKETDREKEREGERKTKKQKDRVKEREKVRGTQRLSFIHCILFLCC